MTWMKCHSKKEVELIDKTSIRNLHSDKDIPPRFCNVIVNGDDVTLEVKINKNKFETISWEDMQYQVNQAIMKAAKE